MDKDTNTSSSLYDYLKVRDFYSNIMETNKALETSYKEEINGKTYGMKKKIFSNNQYTLFFKNRFVEGLINNDKETIPLNVFLKGIDRYFESLVLLGTNKKEDKEILKEIKNDISTEEEILSKRELLKDKFIETVEILKVDNLTKDTWIKIFLEADEKEYKRATLKYISTKIFNKNDENIKKQEKLYGINNYNYGYTTGKKPFTELKSTPFKVGSRVTLDDIKKVRNMYIWLLKNVAIKDFVKIPLSYNFIDELDKIKCNNEPVYLLKVINDNGTVIVKDFDFIPFYSENIKEFRCTNCFNTSYNLDETEFITKDIYELENRTSKIWFSNSLKESYYNFKEIVSKRTMLPNWKKEILKEKSNIFFEFFHKTNSNSLKQNLDNIAYFICYNFLIDGFKDNSKINAIKAMNLWFAFDEYFGGDFKMIKNEIFEKSKDVIRNNGEIESDEMYFFFVGQVVKYLLDKSKASNKTQSMIDPIMKASNNEKIISIILAMRDKYSHELRLVNTRFDNILKQILTNNVQKDVVKNRKYILAGFLEENLFYMK